MVSGIATTFSLPEFSGPSSIHSLDQHPIRGISSRSAQDNRVRASVICASVDLRARLRFAEVLSDHTTLELECVDRMYLHVYVRLLQPPAGIAWYLRDECGFPVPSPVLLGRRSHRFVAAIQALRQLRAQMAPLLGVSAQHWSPGTHDLPPAALAALQADRTRPSLAPVPDHRRRHPHHAVLPAHLCTPVASCAGGRVHANPPRGSRLKRTVEVFDREIDRL